MDKQRLFDFCLATLILIEGGKVKRSYADDPGGATNIGISLRFLKGLGVRGDLDGDGDVDEDDVNSVTNTIAGRLYRTEFWEKAHCDKLPPVLALCVFDMAVHSGPITAIKTLQKAIGTAPDGKYGPRTNAAANSIDIGYAMSRYMLLREQYCRTLGNWSANADGWMRRFYLIAFSAGIINAANID